MTDHQQTPEEKLNIVERTLEGAEQKLGTLVIEDLQAWQTNLQDYWQATTTIEEFLPQLAILKEITDLKKDIQASNRFNHLLGCNQPIWNAFAIVFFTPFVGFFVFLILSISVNHQLVFGIGLLLSIILGIWLTFRYWRSPKVTAKRALVGRAKTLKTRWLAVNAQLNNFKIPRELTHFVYPLLVLMRDDIRKGSLLNLKVLNSATNFHKHKTKEEKVTNPYGFRQAATQTTYEGTLASISMILVDKSRLILQIPYRIHKLHARKYNRRRTKIKLKIKSKMWIMYFFSIKIAPEKTFDIQRVQTTFPKSDFTVDKNVLKLKTKEKYKNQVQMPNLELVKGALKEIFKNVKEKN